MDMFLTILEDMIFSALASIGFASISNTPRSAMKYCAITAAIGHCLRTILMESAGMHIIPASTIGAFAIALVAIPCAQWVKCPPESFSFPAMLPMIPGMYAYRTVQGLVLCLGANDQGTFLHYFYLMCYNGLTCTLIIAGLVVGVSMPNFIFKKLSFTSTKNGPGRSDDL